MRVKRGEKHGTKRKNKITAKQFIWYGREMIESPAYRVLSLQARKVMRRLELEHLAHGGQENGRLPCRYQDFVEYGCRKNTLAAALIEVQVLGFAITVRLGTKAFANIPGKATTFRLTYLASRDGPASNEWKAWKTTEDARKAVAEAQRKHDEWLDQSEGSPRRRRRKKQNASPRSAYKVGIDPRTKSVG